MSNMRSKLQRVSPESLGISSRSLVKMYEEIDKNKMPLHQFIVMRHGKVATVGCKRPFTKEAKHMMYSTSKTVTSLAIGLCIEEGQINLDDKIVDFFPEKITGPLHEYNEMRTIEHLLTMTGGEEGTTESINRNYPDWVKTYLNTKPRVKPGTLFGYDNSATHVLSAIIQKVSGVKLIDYITPRLLEPLGIEGAYWEEQMGVNTASRGFHASIEDIAKIAQLVLQKGQWEGKQIISKQWIETSTSKHVEVTNFGNIDGNPGYGYKFWLYRDGSFGSNGVGGQHFIVYPKYDIVWAFTGNFFDYYGNGSSEFMHMVWPLLIESIKSNESLAEDEEAFEQLIKIENKLELPLPNHIKENHIKEYLIVDKTFVLASNDAQFHTIRIEELLDGLKFDFMHGANNDHFEIFAKQQHWTDQYVSITKAHGWSNYVWRSEDMMELVIHLKEHVGSYRIIMMFNDDDSVSLEIISLGWIRDYKQLSLYCMGYYNPE